MSAGARLPQTRDSAPAAAVGWPACSARALHPRARGVFGPLARPAQSGAGRSCARAAGADPRLAWLGAHPLGTDQLGRDIASRIVSGSRVTPHGRGSGGAARRRVGVALGILAGYLGAAGLDRVLMRLVDMQLAIPLMLLALMVVAALGPSLRNLIVVLALTSWVRYARIVRGQVLALRERDFVLAARTIGAGTLRIMRHHLLPNVPGTALVVATLELARVILLEAALSFLGLGIQPPAASWGGMLAEGRVSMSQRLVDRHASGPRAHVHRARGQPRRRLAARPARPP